MTKRVLHVVQDFASGVATAMTQYVSSTPQFEHHLLHARTAAAYLPDGELDGFETVRVVDDSVPAAVRGVRLARRELQPHVIHAHSSFGGVFARLAVRSGPRTRIAYTPHCFGFERRDQPPAMLQAYRLAERLLALNTTVTVACSPREAMLAAGLRRAARVVYVPNVPAALPDRSPKAARPTVVGVGRLSPQKAPEEFARAVQALRARVPDVDAVWIGDGDAQRRAVLEHAGVRVTGWLPRGEALAITSSATAYLHTAAWEGFPVSVLEAARLGTPVVARRIAAFDGVHAPESALVPDPDAAASALVQLLADEGRRAQNLRGWTDAFTAHTPETQAAVLAAVYD